MLLTHIRVGHRVGIHFGAGGDSVDFINFDTAEEPIAYRDALIAEVYSKDLHMLLLEALDSALGRNAVVRRSGENEGVYLNQHFFLMRATYHDNNWVRTYDRARIHMLDWGVTTFLLGPNSGFEGAERSKPIKQGV